MMKTAHGPFLADGPFDDNYYYRLRDCATSVDSGGCPIIRHPFESRMGAGFYELISKVIH
ncbi:hypothetical protein GCM10009094_41580 [Massilia aurea]